MSGEAERFSPPAKRKWRRMLGITFWTFLILFFVILSNLQILLELPFHLFLGWFLHATSASIHFFGLWKSSLLPLGALILTVFILHRFILWWLTAKSIIRTWLIRDTLSCTALLLLGCCAAIAMSGIIHQTVWLAGEKWTENSSIKSIHERIAIVNARLLLLALENYHDAEGRYPDSLQELEARSLVQREILRVRTNNNGPTEPFILLDPGGNRPNEEPLIVSPVFNSRGRIIVGLSSLVVKTRPAVELDQILRSTVLRNSPGSLPNP